MGGFDFLSTDYTIWGNFLYLFIALSLIIFIRYILLSETYIRAIYQSIKKKNRNRILSHKTPTAQRNKEILWSGISSILFGLIGVIMIMAWQKGYTRIYTDWSDYPIWYVPISLILATFIHETYYYWLHRWMHRPLVYRYIHKIHHDSVSTSAWTSFSFHPIESLLQAIIIPIILVLIPLQIYVMVFFLIFMTISAIVNHAGVEVFPAGSEKHWLGKYLIGATHHDQHHRRFLYNYGLYFTFWDRWMDTETSDYEEVFAAKTERI